MKGIVSSSRRHGNPNVDAQTVQLQNMWGTKPELKGKVDKPTITDGHFNTHPSTMGRQLDKNWPGYRRTQ